MPKSKPLRLAVEGMSTDGRPIERQDLIDMASDYDPKVYTARVDLEHIKSVHPESSFRAYGDVLNLSTEEIKDGPLAGKMALYGAIDGTDDLVALNKKRQKVFPSIQYHPTSTLTGKAYLFGLAMTDTPASYGTEMLEFCSKAKANPLEGRKLAAGCVIAESGEEMKLEFVEDKPNDGGMQFLSRIKSMLTGESSQRKEDTNQMQQAVLALAESQKDTLDKLTSLSAGAGESVKLREEVITLKNDLATLTQQLSVQDGSNKKRDPATGGNEKDNIILADC
ncbi:MAG: GPO family capsid scaffolding protein [Ewingella sp.]